MFLPQQRIKSGARIKAYKISVLLLIRVKIF